MTGAEHYQEAQRLLAVCAGPQRGTELDLARAAAAQVHATLAVAAYLAGISVAAKHLHGLAADQAADREGDDGA